MANIRKYPKIEVGKTYTNRFGQKTKRKVLAIGMEYRPEFYGNMKITGHKNEWIPRKPGVMFEENGQIKILFWDTFANWVGHVVK